MGETKKKMRVLSGAEREQARAEKWAARDEQTANYLRDNRCGAHREFACKECGRDAEALGLLPRKPRATETLCGECGARIGLYRNPFCFICHAEAFHLFERAEDGRSFFNGTFEGLAASLAVGVRAVDEGRPGAAAALVSIARMVSEDLAESPLGRRRVDDFDHQ